MPEATSPIPPKRPEDPEEVAQELTLAANSWQSGDQNEALAALRRAASVAYRLHAGRRVSELAKAVSELSKTIMGGSLSMPSPKTSPSVPSAAMRAAAPNVPKAPPLPITPIVADDGDDIPISLEDVEDAEVADDPFPSAPLLPALMAQPTIIATPGAKKPALGGKKEPAAAATANDSAAEGKAARASSRPGKSRRSTPPKAKEKDRERDKDLDRSGSLVAMGAAATAETSGVLDVGPSSQRESSRDDAKEPKKDAQIEIATNGVNISSTEEHGERLTYSGEAPSNPALHHRPTPVGEDTAILTPKPSPSAPPPTKTGSEAVTPNPPAAKPAPAKSSVAVDAPTVADLANIGVLASLDAAARTQLIATAKLLVLAKGERTAAPSIVVVIRGELEVRPKERAIAIDRIPTGEARVLDGMPPSAGGDLVLVAGDAGARCLSFPKGAFDSLRQSAPEVYKTIERRTDELCAFAAISRERPIGSLADALLLELRKKSEVRRLAEGTIIVRTGEAVRALVVVASGALTLHADDKGPEMGRIRPGEVLLPRELVAKTAAPREVRVGAGGVVLLAARKGPTLALLDENTHLRKALETWGADDPFQEW